MRKFVIALIALVIPSLAIAEPKYLECQIAFIEPHKEDIPRHFQLMLDEETGKITHTWIEKDGGHGAAVNVDGFFSANTISYEWSSTYQIDRTTLKVEGAWVISPDQPELTWHSRGSCKIVEMSDRKI